MHNIIEENSEDTKGVTKNVNRKRTDNTMDTRKQDNGLQKTLHRKLQTEPH